MELTDGMKEALRQVAYGVRKYSDGYRSTEDISVRVDERSLQALLRRKLIGWESVGGFQPMIHLHLAPEGKRIFEEELRYAR